MSAPPIETNATLVYRLCVVLLVGRIHFNTAALHYPTQSMDQSGALSGRK